MYARAVDEAARNLRELRQEEWGTLGLAAFALGLAVAATEFRPALALPLFLGGLGVGVLGLRAIWRRWDLVDRLAGERDAYTISEVRDYALRETTMERRRTLAAYARSLRESMVARQGRVTAASAELEALACELEDEELALDPASAVACVRLLTDVASNALVGGGLPAEVLRSRVIQIRRGFGPTRLVA